MIIQSEKHFDYKRPLPVLLTSLMKRNLKDISNDILVDDILYWVRANRNSINAILSSVSYEKRIYVDEWYIQEKMNAVKDINKWLPRYFQEARDRYTSGTLSDEQRVQMQPYFK